MGECPRSCPSEIESITPLSYYIPSPLLKLQVLMLSSCVRWHLWVSRIHNQQSLETVAFTLSLLPVWNLFRISYSGSSWKHIGGLLRRSIRSLTCILLKGLIEINLFTSSMLTTFSGSPSYIGILECPFWRIYGHRQRYMLCIVNTTVPM